MTYSPPNINDIFQEIRWLTASGNTSQLSDEDIEKYMNTFYLYDLPAKYRSLKLKDKYTFNTIKGVDTYYFDSEHYTTIEQPCYCAKREIQLFTDPWSFYGVNFNWQSQENFATGTGNTATLYTGNTSGHPLSPSINNDPGLFASPNVDYPIGKVQNILITANIGFGETLNATDDGQGNIIQIFQTPVGSSYQAKYGPSRFYSVVIGAIDYETGAISNLRFQSSNNANPPVFSNVAVPSGESIQIQYNPQVLSIPLSILFFQNQFTLRPVPDRGYTIELIAYRQPCQALLGFPAELGGTGTGVTELSEWWMILAYGAAKKIYKRRLDSDGEALMDAALKEQYDIIETRTYAQIGKQRTNTIFADQLQYNYGAGAGFFGGV